MSISVEEEVLKLKAAERVRQDGTQSVIAEVEPAQRDEVGERADFERVEAALAEVEVFQTDERRQVDAPHHRRVEGVAVDVQLEAVGGHAGRDGAETATRAVDDAARRVAEAQPRAAETVAGRQGVDEDRPDEALDDRQQTAARRRRRSHCLSRPISDHDSPSVDIRRRQSLPGRTTPPSLAASVLDGLRNCQSRQRSADFKSRGRQRVPNPCCSFVMSLLRVLLCSRKVTD